MPGLTNADIPDLLNAALPHFNRKDGGFESTLELQNYAVLDKLFDKEKRKVKNGESISMRILLRASGQAQHMGLYESKARSVDSYVEKVTGHWTHTETDMSYDARELIMASGESEIFDILKSRRQATYEGLANLIEQDCQVTPENASDTKSPLGFPFWICPMAPGTESVTGGFNGDTVVYADGSTSNVTAGIDRSAARNRRFRNWNATYSDFDASTLELMRKACRYTDFRGPRMVKKVNGMMSPIWSWFVNLDIANQYEELVNAGPDDRRGDYSPFNGELSFKKIPVQATAALNGISYDPIYLINTKCFFPYVLGDRWVKEGKAMNDVDSHNVYTVPVDCSWQLFCTNVRNGGAVIHKPIAA